MGPEYQRAGYDPVLQAMTGYMEVTGDPKGPADAHRHPGHRPQGRRRACNVMRALLERHETGAVRRSTSRCCRPRRPGSSPCCRFVDFGCAPGEITRRQRAPKFIPTNVYRRATDSSTSRSARTCSGAGSPRRRCSRRSATRSALTNEGRHAERGRSTATWPPSPARYTADEVLAVLRGATIPCTRILDIPQVRALPAIAGRLPQHAARRTVDRHAADGRGRCGGAQNWRSRPGTASTRVRCSPRRPVRAEVQALHEAGVVA